MKIPESDWRTLIVNFIKLIYYKLDQVCSLYKFDQVHKVVTLNCDNYIQKNVEMGCESVKTRSLTD